MKKRETDIKLSKLMTKMLRHKPLEAGLVLDEEDGSCPVESLVKVVQGLPGWAEVKLADIERVVRNSDKQRFEINEGRIRAKYGHSYQKVNYEPGMPPAVLYHGTSKHTLPFILADGLEPMGRQYVHLSETVHFATLAGNRKGELALLTVDTQKAMEEGIPFYYAGNEVWLAEWIPWAYCDLEGEATSDTLEQSLKQSLEQSK